MTKRRPKNKKPSGVNRSLGSCLSNEREKARLQHRRRERGYNAENVQQIRKDAVQNIDSVTDETGLEEFLAKAELAGTNFAAERGEFRLLDLEESNAVVKTTNATYSVDELYAKYGDRLRIPRRPPEHMWETADDLTCSENEYFLKWRKSLADLQSDGVLLTPFERNLELWRQLWRVIERSDIVVQILDARNPLLFRSVDLEAFVKECGIAKQNIYLVNKVDLLTKEQIEFWRKWFLDNEIDAAFWSAMKLETSKSAEKKEEDMTELDDSKSSSSSNETEVEEENTMGQDRSESCGSTIESGGDGKDICFSNSSEVESSENADITKQKIPVLNSEADLIAFFKSRGHVQKNDAGRRPLVVGMVGYPNVGKSSTINKILNQKKVSVSATPGKTRHLQTLIVDDELTLCDCPGLVMPSFALSRDDMILNGILSIDNMRDYQSPVALLLTRIPRRYFEKIYSVMLGVMKDDSGDDMPLSAHDLLTAVAFIRGYMSSSGLADRSRSARLILKDVVNGKVKWVAAPPNVDQKEFDKLTYGVIDEVDSSRTKPSSSIMQQLQKRRLLQDVKASDKLVDEQFFLGSKNEAHVRPLRSSLKLTSANSEERPSKKHFNKGKREKLRRIFAD